MELQLPNGDSLSGLPHTVAFSQSLELIYMDGVLYNIGEKTGYVKPQVLPLWLAHSSVQQAHEGPAIKDHFSCLKADFSACNKYLSLLSTGDVYLHKHPYLHVYLLEPLSKNSITCVNIPRNLDMSQYVFALTAWHPNSPILSVIACELDSLSSSGEIQLLLSCYVLDFSVADARWVKAEQTFLDRLPSTCQVVWNEPS